MRSCPVRAVALTKRGQRTRWVLPASAFQKAFDRSLASKEASGDAVKNYPPPQYRTIVEPFAGSAGYSVRYAHLNVVLCDVDPAITAVCEFRSARVPLDNFLYQGGLTPLADRFPACASARDARRPPRRHLEVAPRFTPMR